MSLADPTSRKLISISAPTGKSGTNYLFNVLLHLGLARLPEVDPLTREDHLLRHADLLLEYVDRTAAIWSGWKESADNEGARAALLSALGSGLEMFIGARGRPPVVVKTPSADNLHLGPLLFPAAVFIIIVRDGRDVAESGVRSGYWNSHREAIESWADGVAKVLHFVESQRAEPRGVRWALRRRQLYLAHCPADSRLRPDRPVAGLGRVNARSLQEHRRT